MFLKNLKIRTMMFKIPPRAKFQNDSTDAFGDSFYHYALISGFYDIAANIKYYLFLHRKPSNI